MIFFHGGNTKNLEGLQTFIEALLIAAPEIKIGPYWSEWFLKQTGSEGTRRKTG
jgi:hypothetical protein